MSKHDFPFEEFADRRRRVRAAIHDARLDWLIAFHPVSIHWLTGSDAKSYQAFQCLFIPGSDDRLTMLTREGEQAEYSGDAFVDELAIWGHAGPTDPMVAFDEVASRLGLKGARVGIEVPAYYLHPHHYQHIKAWLGAALVAEPTTLIHDLKLVKSPREIAYVRKAAVAADLSIRAFIDGLAPGRSEAELVSAIYANFLAAGAGQPATPVNLVSGPRAGFSHGAPTERRLAHGDFGNVEYCVPYRRYSVSIGRQFAIGKPTARMSHLYSVAREAADACIAEIRDGVPASRPHEAAAGVIARAGLDAYRIHVTGYGLAPAFPPATAEPIQIAPTSRYMLRAGMVLSICPPIFIAEEKLGARVVDNVLVTASGAEILSTVARDLIVVD